MKNILFVGPYRQTDGWGNAAKEYIRALRLTGHNLAVRPVYLNHQEKWDQIEEFRDLESASYEYDVIIQNCLPHMFRRYGGVKNIGLSYFESTVRYTPWPASINLMDRMWVTSKFEQWMLENSKVSTDIDVISIPCDAEKYNKEYSYELLKEHHGHEFKFYFIGEFISRKNLNALIIAFHREFSPNEQVRLVLKLNRVGLGAEDTLRQAQAMIQSTRKSMGMYKNQSSYKSEILLLKYLSNDELYGLHNDCDCFVMPSSGEAFCIPAFDATMFGSAPIINVNSSMVEYVDGDVGYFARSYKTPAIAEDRPLPYLYNTRDTWFKVDILSLQTQMRWAYDDRNRKTREERKEYARKNILPKFTYESIAKKMAEVL